MWSPQASGCVEIILICSFISPPYISVSYVRLDTILFDLYIQTGIIECVPDSKTFQEILNNTTVDKFKDYFESLFQKTDDSSLAFETVSFFSIIS